MGGLKGGLTGWVERVGGLSGFEDGLNRVIRVLESGWVKRWVKRWVNRMG